MKQAALTVLFTILAICAVGPVAAEDADQPQRTLFTNVNVFDGTSDKLAKNTNGLLRQYFPKGMDLSNVHQNRLNAVARRLNERPRETLNFETPAERFNQCVASTG